MATVTFVVNDELIDGIGRLRLWAESPKNWKWLTNDRLELTEFSHLISSGDIEAAFAFVVTADYTCRHLSLRLKNQMIFSQCCEVPTEIAFTLANLLGYTGAVCSQSGIVVEPGSQWVVGTNPFDGALIVQQKVRRVAQA